MRKKFGVLLLALVLIVGGFTACLEDSGTPEERAFSAWSHYLELTGAFQAGSAGAWAADFTMDIEMDISVMTIRLESTGHMAHIQTDGQNMQMLMDMTTDMGMMGGEMAMVMYLNMIDGDTNLRMIMDGYELPDELIDAEMMDTMTMSIPEFNIGDIESVEIEEEGEYTRFHFQLDQAALNDYVQEVLGD